jgi:hypothetical protein
MEMERALQYWDDLDDLLGVVGLIAESIRRLAIFTITTAIFLAAMFAGVSIALAEPPLALAIVILLLVTLLYRSVTRPMLVRTVQRA